MRILKKLGAIVGGLSAMFLTGCAQQIVDLTVSNDGYNVHRDIAYGAGARRKLDVYVPENLDGPAPVLLFFYGGAWQSGSKDLYKGVGQSLATEGVIVVIADYRIYPEVRYPEFLRDAASAFRFVQASIAPYGGDPENIFLAGHSAGAYIAVMIASEPSYLAAEGVELSAINGVIGIAGPYNFLPLQDNDLIDIFGGRERVETQPIQAIDGTRPPMLLVTGSEDETVYPRNVTTMAARLREFDSPVQTMTYEGDGHLGVILSLSWPFRERNSLRADMLDFIGDESG